jgi:cell wall-associated NlpC family hydrolase
VVAAACAVALVSASAVIPASADPIGDKQRQANQIADEIERLGDAAADLGEEYNGAVVRLQQADADVKAAETKLGELEAKLGSVRTAASAFALRAYMYADQTSGVASLLSGTSIDGGSAQREGYNTVALGNTADVTDNMKALIEDADRQKAALETARSQQAQLAQFTKDRQKAAETAQAKQQQTLVKVKGELATLVQQEQKRRADAEAAQALADRQRAEAALQQAAQAQAQAAQAQARAATSTTAPAAAPGSTPSPSQAIAPKKATTTTAPDTGTSDGGPTSSTGGGNDDGDEGGSNGDQKADPPAVDVPPTSPGAATAVRAALSQLGVPYKFAAAEPGVAFDCSGLTMWAWAQAGVSLPHFAASQYRMLPHVAREDLQPGDLVFFYSDLHHVGIYIGNGNFVQAPRTGDVVKISPLAGRNYVGAARP